MLSIPSSALARILRSTRPTATSVRSLAMKPREEFSELPPNFSMDSIHAPPHGIGESEEPDRDPMHYDRKPVSSAHSVDLSKATISSLDSAAFGPSGSVDHGRFGRVDAAAASTVPLEYLALLRPASEGATALREITEASGESAPGTLLVYGASRPAAMAAVQLAASAGCAVVAVVDGQHSGHDEMVDTIKGMTREPGTAVAEEYALCKANFRDLVERTVSGEDTTAEGFHSARFLSDFKANLIEYTQTYPDDLPAAVHAEELKFVGKEKDRANFKANISAYLSQFSPGAAPIDSALLDAHFTVDQYELFKKKFGRQTTAVISGGDGVTNTDRFAPAEIVSNMISAPEEPVGNEPTDYPFEFSIKNYSPAITPPLKGGPIMGAIIEVTPELSAAAEAVSKAKSLRGKAEALQFLTDGQRNAHAAASSVVSLARKAGAPIRTVGGSLPGLDAIQEPSENDITAALDAMAIGNDGTSRLNYFIQVYRAGDFPVYEHYAIHRAMEPLAGPRQIIVTK